MAINDCKESPTLNISRSRAHVAAYVRAYGNHIPEGWGVHHCCDNPRCAEPEHLIIGTQEDNIQDMRDRDRFVRGENHGKAKLSAEDVLEIRQRNDAGQRQLAREYGVTHSAIQGILSGKTWTHI